MKLFFLSAAALLAIVNGATIRGSEQTTEIDFASWSCNTNKGTCPDDRIAYMCEDDVQVCCLVTLSAAEEKILNTRGKARREMLRQFSEVDLDGHGKCAVNVEEEDVRIYLLSNSLTTSTQLWSTTTEIPEDDETTTTTTTTTELITTTRHAAAASEEVKDMFLSELTNGMEEFEEESRIMCRKGCRSGYRLVAPCSCVRDYDDNGDNGFDNDDAVGQTCQHGTDCGNGRGSQWMCRGGYCERRSEFEMEMEQVIE